MESKPSFFKENTALVVSITFVALAFVGGFLTSVWNADDEAPAAQPTFTLEETGRESSLRSPAALSQVIFAAVKAENPAALHPCLLTPQEFEATRRVITQHLDAHPEDAAYLPALTTYEDYRAHLTARFSAMLAQLEAMDSFTAITLDDTAPGTRMDLGDVVIYDQPTLSLSVTDQQYQKTQFKVHLRTFVRTRAGVYRLLR